MNRSKKNDISSPRLDALLKALANPVRREILGWLKDPRGNFPEQAHPFDLGVCAGQIERRAGLSQSTVSAHLAILQKAGLVSARKVGPWSFFQRDEEAIRAHLETLSRAL